MASMHARTHAAKHAPTRRHHRSVQAGTSETSRVQLNPPQEPEPTKPPQIPPSKNKPLPTLPLRLRLYTARTRKKRDWIRRSEREEIPSRQSPVAHEAAGRRERRRVAYTLGPIRTGKEEEEEAGGGSAAAPRGRRRRGEARSSASLPLLWRRWSGWGAGGGGGGVWGWGTQVVEWSAQRRGGKGNSFSAPQPPRASSPPWPPAHCRPNDAAIARATTSLSSASATPTSHSRILHHHPPSHGHHRCGEGVGREELWDGPSERRGREGERGERGGRG
uniref:Uncharacterized protein n=1 Tax=Oryza sativa subsp. japonica TaxID=39947 RepID=Q8S5P7_ORYSJ|nr:Hypothetical protein [Oryza sativa Japonica Group]